MILECKWCIADVDAQILNSYEEFDKNINFKQKFIFVKCPRCNFPFIAYQEDTGDGDGWTDPTLWHTSRDTAFAKMEIPSQIKFAFEEAAACFKARAYTATAIMCRKTLEVICAEHGITGGNLVFRLKRMKDSGIIENGFFEWADLLRITGNEAAHDLDITISDKDANDILDFTNALTQYIYNYRNKFELFKQRRLNKDD